MSQSHAASASPLSRLPSVLVHLVMQQLQFEELARLASTCHLMQSDALHPSVGCYALFNEDHFVSLNPPEPSTNVLPAVPWMRELVVAGRRVHSPLGRAHLPVTIDARVILSRPEASPQLAAMSHSQRVAALVEKLAGWSHVHTLDLEGADNWAEQDALTLLRSPTIQRIKHADNAAGVWLRESVQTALCRLPLLESLDVSFEADHPSLRLHPSAFAHATALRSLEIRGIQAPSYKLAGLVSVSAQLTSLEIAIDQYSEDEGAARELPTWLMQHCRPMLSQLRVLKLGHFNFGLYLAKR